MPDSSKASAGRSRRPADSTVTIFDLMAAARRYRTSGTGAKVTLIVLVEHLGLVGEEWQCWPSVGKVARETQQSEGTVRRHLGEFEVSGLISKRSQGRKGGGRLPNLLVVDVDRLLGRVPDSPDQTAHDGGFARSANRASEGGQTAHPADAAPLIEVPEKYQGNDTHASSATESPDSARSSPDDLAREVVTSWWEERKLAGNPVGQPFIACHKVVVGMIRNGVHPRRIAWALRNSPVCSTGALEFAIQHRLARSANNSAPPDPVRMAAQARDRYREAGQ